MQNEYCQWCGQPLEEWEAGLCEGCGMKTQLQKKLNGVWVFASHGCSVTLICGTDKRWTATYRSPFFCHEIVKCTRDTRRQAMDNALAHLEEDAELSARGEE